MGNEHYGIPSHTVEFPSGGPDGHTGDATARNPVGAKYRWKGVTYRYCLFDNGTGNVAGEKGAVCYWLALDEDADPPVYTVTTDQTDSLFGKRAAGIMRGIVVDARYCWIQISGEADTVTVPGAVEGDIVTGSTTDKQGARIASGSNITDIPIGVVREGTTASGAKVLLQGLDW